MWYAISLTVGLALLAVSTSLFYNTFHLINSGQRTTATVSKIIEGKSKSGKTYKPLFRFKTDNGEEIHHEYRFSTSPSDWEIGDTRVVFYDANEPENSVVLTYYDAFGEAIMVLIFGLIFTFIGGRYYLSEMYFNSLLKNTG